MSGIAPDMNEHMLVSSVAPETSETSEDASQAALFRRPRPTTIITALLLVAATLGAIQFRSSISPFAGLRSA